VSGYGTTLTVRRQARDSDGDLVGDGTDRVFTGWLFEPSAATEDRDSGRGTRDAAVTRIRGFARDPGLDITAGDRAYLAGDDPAAPPPWHVIGDPERWSAPGWSGLAGTVITLERTTG
jgi:hypothetical protein